MHTQHKREKYMYKENYIHTQKTNNIAIGGKLEV